MKYINAKTIINPNLPMLKYLYIAFPGRKVASMFAPSSGGIGIKLNIPRKYIYPDGKINH